MNTGIFWKMDSSTLIFVLVYALHPFILVPIYMKVELIVVLENSMLC